MVEFIWYIAVAHVSLDLLGLILSKILRREQQDGNVFIVNRIMLSILIAHIALNWSN